MCMQILEWHGNPKWSVVTSLQKGFWGGSIWIETTWVSTYAFCVCTILNLCEYTVWLISYIFEQLYSAPDPTKELFKMSHLTLREMLTLRSTSAAQGFSENRFNNNMITVPLRRWMSLNILHHNLIVENVEVFWCVYVCEWIWWWDLGEGSDMHYAVFFVSCKLLVFSLLTYCYKKVLWVRVQKWTTKIRVHFLLSLVNLCTYYLKREFTNPNIWLIN